MTEKRPICCNKPMMKSGYGWSGHRKVPVFRCNVCGKRRMVSREDYVRKEK